jgi:hypothetical protein
MVSIISPNKDFPPFRKSLFLAGTITGSKFDWQGQVTEALKDFDVVIFNPRRDKNPEDIEDIREQIAWEFEMLRNADVISFWFGNETIAPITLFELGSWSMTQKPLVVGVDPEYPRKFDVEVQLKLVRPEVKIVYSLDALSNEISETLNFLFQM